MTLEEFRSVVEVVTDIVLRISAALGFLFLVSIAFLILLYAVIQGFSTSQEQTEDDKE